MSDEAERLYERLLVLRCQTGDEDAYRELVTRFGPRLRYFLLKLTARADKVDDLVQETWLDVLRQLPRLKDAAVFTAWLYRIAHGKAMLDGRRNGRELVVAGEVEDAIEEQSEPVFSPDEAVRIHAALDQLEPRHREVLVLRFLEELSYEEIGQVVDCPVGTVRSRIHYAKTALKRMLQ
ncbi:MAG TPA: sigma-70 family RNA polymerase sigma factor [Lacipirellulaceae bacterium]|jgi:RNA polymerase sigma-70 factor (ECF subfamily)|nr:sigma-70 family RNA polymerase sigma factor [Lacipirellulaceae bacterium]